MRRNGLTRIYRGNKGFSLIELLIAVIIIGILASILIPVVSNRSEKARIASAEADLERIAEAMSQAAVDTGYYPRMFMLNDSRGTASLIDSPTSGDTFTDGVRDYGTTANDFHQNTSRLFINTLTGQSVSVGEGSMLLNKLQSNETTFNWNGAYINFRRDENIAGSGPYEIDNPDGIPDDPWGNNYLFLTKAGLLIEPDGQFVSGNVNFPIYGSTTLATVPGRAFDRATVLSLGPNGLPGDGNGSALGTDDDIFRTFGQ